MNRRSFLFAMLLSGCAVSQPLSPKATLILKPMITPGRLTETVNVPYNTENIDHLVMKFYTVEGETEQDTGIIRTLNKSQLNSPLVVSNQRVNSRLRIKAYAYASEDDSFLLSLDNSDSWTDIVIGTDDRPTFSQVKVHLIDKPFDAQALSSVDILASFNVDGTESVVIPKLVNLLAGSGESGCLDGTGTAATFASPRGIALDASYSIFVAQDNCIRKVTSAGVVTTFVGGSVAGAADGNGTAAAFNTPAGMVFDTAGNLYVADSGNHLIRKVTPAGTVTTFAGNGTPGYTEANGVLASFHTPSELAIDASGSLYVADTANYCIRKITSAGDVSTFAGNGNSGNTNGSGTAASFSSVYGLALDAQGNLYVADSDNALIRKVTSTGVVSTLLGSGLAGFSDGRGTAAQISSPRGLAIDALQNMYLADYGNRRMRKVTLDGRISSIAGNGASSFNVGLGSAATLSPRAVIAHPFGPLYVTDELSHRVLSLQ